MTEQNDFIKLAKVAGFDVDFKTGLTIIPSNDNLCGVPATLNDLERFYELIISSLK